ncbi:lipoprotein-releasing system permease protein [Pseudoxanthobacter soli DSM 19599]|uniref:Lipoprotein-releasing system permease protein n=1 Tax=Pseudoxanthobacter soli DSM 19599 TaxID=1123029 RepID=A0A1M7ZMR3_9HYPH|nr:lipoprotein-releasing ABC transporter permease subunit [Pseudoxanthobacter soli]SHO66185.1 lipoprotein-releasing system permease protein [Pseudoxanthobacter soli DSM 19599]
MAAKAGSAGKARPRGVRPFSALEWTIAGRYLRSRRRETFISVIAGFSFLGIMLGVATLIIVMAVMNGFRNELMSKILGINGHVLVQPINGTFDNYMPVVERLQKIHGVRFAMPFVEGQALISGPSGAYGALVRGVRQQDLDRLPLIASTVRAGTLNGFDRSNGVAVGGRLAMALGVALGDPVTLVTPKGEATPFGVVPRTQAFPVVATFEIGMSEFDSSFVFMPMAEAQAFFNKENAITGIEVYLNDPDDIDRLRSEIEQAAGQALYLTDWRIRQSTFFSALEVERNVMFMILTLIVLVAALNIISGLTMLVKDKGRDIAILRTMGATRGTILRVFVITGAAIGTVGTAAGLVIGLIVCHYIEPIRQGVSWLTRTQLFPPELYYLSQLPADIDSGETVTVVVMALVLSFLATLYPAWKAARLDPVEGLRHE